MTVHRPTIKQLQYLVALRQHGHFGRAAESCFVTQSTLSRDMKELRLARVQTPEGARYTSPAESTEGRHAALSALLPQLFLRLDGVGVLLVMKTTVGSAEAAAAVLDAENSSDLVGTLAGDDTVLLICRSEAARERLSRRILQLARR